MYSDSIPNKDKNDNIDRVSTYQNSNKSLLTCLNPH